jgi:hypothetical protein
MKKVIYFESDTDLEPVENVSAINNSYPRGCPVDSALLDENTDERILLRKASGVQWTVSCAAANWPMGQQNRSFALSSGTEDLRR